MDCVRRGSVLDNVLDLDNQRFETVGGIANIKTDAKLLWSQQAIPMRTVFFYGYLNNDNGQTVLSQATNYLENTLGTWRQIKWGEEWGEIVPGGPIPPGTIDQGIIGAGIARVGAVQDFMTNSASAYPISAWWWGTVGGNNLITADYQNIFAYVSQVICPNAFAPQNYEIWQCTIRAYVGNMVGPVPGPAPWSQSTDFVKITTGTLNPGQFITIHCPVEVQPQAPPAPPNTNEPYDITYWTGWGVVQFLIFT